jgi:metallo-beta-lactamase family protein
MLAHAASGMCEAGRVRKHLTRLLWRKDATVLLPGYQAVGTLGRILAEGARSVRIQGEDIMVRAKVRSLDVYSGHADQAALVSWAKARRPVNGEIFLVHGEPEGLSGLREALIKGGFDAERICVPDLDARFDLGRTTIESRPTSQRLVPAQAATPDWHNARARLLLDLNGRLEALPSDAEREALLAELAHVLGSAPKVDQRQRRTAAALPE